MYQPQDFGLYSKYHTVINGAIHWKVSMLKTLAPYSLETVLSFGTGGFFPRFNGLSRLYQGLFVSIGAVLFVSVVNVDVVVVVVNVLCVFGRPSFSGSDVDISLSDPTYCSGAVATGSALLVDEAVTAGSMIPEPFS